MAGSAFLTGFLVVAQLSGGDVVEVAGLQGLGDTRHHSIESTLADHRYDILVGLPAAYEDEPGRRYPVVYLLDGGALYPLLRGYHRYLRIDEAVPPVIMVAVSYGTADWRQGNNRSHDYTVPSDTESHWGGAKDFYRFLEAELLPSIDEQYRTDPDQRILFGQSLGGQFVLFAAQTGPELFSAYIASNPALHRNLDFFLAQRPARPTDARLFVAAASDDDPRFGAPARRWIEHWSADESPPWQLEVRTLEGHGHSSAPPAAYRHGMRWLFP